MALGTVYVAPRDEVERSLAAMWEEVLEVDRVGIHDNFFDLGGSSLKALSLMMRIEKTWGAEIPLAEVYLKPTLTELANVLRHDAQGARRTGRYGYLLNPRRAETVFCFSPTIGFHWTFAELASQLDACSIYAFDFVQSDDRLNHYVRSMRFFQPHGPYTLAGYSAGGNLAFQAAKELERRGETVSKLIILDSARRSEKPEFSEQAATELANQYLSDPRFRQISADKETARRFFDCFMAYSRYHASLADEGAIDADIHLILSESSDETQADGWREVTSGSVRIYRGSGRHDQMLDPENAQINGRILEEILSGPQISQRGVIRRPFSSTPPIR
ncbi:MAG: hypothetical protein HY704_04345 [Gemmatimonadetes bacterium]|nr:hypothetical protein [Gemmatimonadota bacterium]